MKKNLLTLIAVFTFLTCFSQIQYTDVNPDLTLQASSSDSYPLDFNADASIDLIIYESEVDTNLNGFVLTFIGGVVNTLGATEIVGTDSLIFGSNILFVDTIGAGELIDGSLGYINSSMPSVFAGAGLRVTATSLNTSLGEFQGAQDGYIGVKFDISGNTHYGWVRVNTAEDCYSLIVKDFAYETTPNTGIIAGDYGGSGLVGFDESIVSNVNILQLNREIYFENITQPTKVQVFNVLGSEIKNYHFKTNQNIILDNADLGLYLLVITTNNNKQVQKIYIQ